jgi:hypothetical protein
LNNKVTNNADYKRDEEGKKSVIHEGNSGDGNYLGEVGVSSNISCPKERGNIAKNNGESKKD